jgi:hypothetical protein
MNGAVNSEALHYNSSHFGKQVSIMMKPSLSVILHAPVNRLEEQLRESSPRHISLLITQSEQRTSKKVQYLLILPSFAHGQPPRDVQHRFTCI